LGGITLYILLKEKELKNEKKENERTWDVYLKVLDQSHWRWFAGGWYRDEDNVLEMGMSRDYILII